MSAQKVLAERQKLYHQGKTHRRFGTKPFYDHHKHYSDYMDGFHGRPFRAKPVNTPFLAKIFLKLAEWSGA